MMNSRRAREIEEFISGAFPQSRSIGIDLGSTQAQKILGANAKRTKLIIQNRGTVSIYIGGPDVTTANGIEIATLETYVDDIVPFSGDVYAIAASGTQNIRVRDEWRESR